MIKSIRVLLVVLLISAATVAPAAAQIPEIIVSDAITMPDALIATVSLVLSAYPHVPAGIQAWAITDALEYTPGTWAISVAGLAGDPSDGWSIEGEAVWLGRVSAYTNIDGSYTVEVLPPEAMGGTTAEEPPDGGGSANTGLIFPWYAGTNVWYGQLGVHTGWTTSTSSTYAGWQAVDFVSDGSTGMAPNMVYAAKSGSVSWACRDGVSLAIRIGDLLYLHLDDNGISTGTYYAQGQAIGPMVEGNFNPPGGSIQCGYAAQDSDTWHLHLAFPPPSNGLFRMESCVLDISTESWTCNGTTVDPGDELTSTWIIPGVPPGSDPPPGDPPPGDEGTTGGARNFWGAILNALTGVIAMLIYGTAPSHTQLGLVTIVTSSVNTVLGATFVLFFSLFRPAFLIAVIKIIMGLEVVRVVLSIMGLFKKTTPLI